MVAWVQKAAEAQEAQEAGPPAPSHRGGLSLDAQEAWSLSLEAQEAGKAAVLAWV